MNIDESLAPFRAQIDAIDAQLVALLAQRFDVVRQVADFKAAHDVAVVQPVRAQAVKDRAIVLGAAQGLDPAFVGTLWEMLIAHAHALEGEIMKNNKDV